MLCQKWPNKQVLHKYIYIIADIDIFGLPLKLNYSSLLTAKPKCRIRKKHFLQIKRATTPPPPPTCAQKKLSFKSLNSLLRPPTHTLTHLMYCFMLCQKWANSEVIHIYVKANIWHLCVTSKTYLIIATSQTHEQNEKKIYSCKLGERQQPLRTHTHTHKHTLKKPKLFGRSYSMPRFRWNIEKKKRFLMMLLHDT